MKQKGTRRAYIMQRNPADAGDSDKLSDRIFSATKVQAQVFLKDGEVTLTTKDLADYYVARSWLREQGFGRVKRAN